MNYKAFRLLLVLVGLVALAQFAWGFVDFVRNEEKYQKRLQVSKMHLEFDQARSRTEEGHLRAWADYSVLTDLNITNEPKPIEEVGPTEPVVVRPKAGPEDLKVKFIQFQPESISLAYLEPTNAPPVPADSTQVIGDIYSEGDRFSLPGKTFKLEVLAIRADEVDLAIVDEEDSGFTILVQDYEVQTDSIRASAAGDLEGPNALVLPMAPEETRTLDGRSYEIGVRDLEEIQALPEDQIFAAVQVSPERDKNTGRLRGLRVKSIRENSVFTRQGLESNDVVLSVNGFPTTDRAELLDWLRRQEGTTSFNVLVERKGSQRSISYRLPPRNR